MTTDRRIMAKRANGQKSTGPQSCGWTIEAQPQRVSPRLVPPLAARHGDIGKDRRHRACTDA